MLKENDSSIAHEPDTTTQEDRDYRNQLEEYFLNSVGTVTERLENFPKYVQQSTLNRFLSRYEIYKMIVGIPGAVVECGILYGGGLMAFSHLSCILEPWAVSRRIIGFDTFAGFQSLSEVDITPGHSIHCEIGGLSAPAFDDLIKGIAIFDQHRPLGHIPKVELIAGDVVQTIPKYVQENPHLVVSLLFLDVDVYEPTKVAIENLVPRMPIGSVIVFDELFSRHWPGETKAALDSLGINKLRLQRQRFSPWMSFAIIE